MGSFLAPMVIAIILTIQIRPMSRPYINRTRWGIASPAREGVRAALIFAVGVTGMWVGETFGKPWGFTIMALAAAIALSWVPGTVRQGIRLSRVPSECDDGIGEAISAIAHERVPDLTLLAVLITPETEKDMKPWMSLERLAFFFRDLPKTHVPADGVPALRQFIRATVFDIYRKRPFNDKPGKTSFSMNAYEFRTTYDIEFADILRLVLLFVQKPVGQWAAIGEAAEMYGCDIALEHGDIPIEYLDTLAERREVKLLSW